MARVDGDIIEFLKVERGKGEFAMAFNWRKPDSKLVQSVGLSFKDANEVESLIGQADQSDVVRAVLTYLVSLGDGKFQQDLFDSLAGRSFVVTTSMVETK